VLIDWWNKNSYGKNCYIGLGIYRAGSNEAWKDKNLLPKQIQLLRQYPNIQGMIFSAVKASKKTPMAGMTVCGYTILPAQPLSPIHLNNNKFYCLKIPATYLKPAFYYLCSRSPIIIYYARF
jgi:hypothetical protein